MTASELRYLLAARSLGDEKSSVRLTDLAHNMRETKVSVYRICQRQKEQELIRQEERGHIFLTQKSLALLEEYTLCIRFISGALENCCHTPKNTAYFEAVNTICAVGDFSRAALVKYLKRKNGTLS